MKVKTVYESLLLLTLSLREIFDDFERTERILSEGRVAGRLLRLQPKFKERRKVNETVKIHL